MVHRIDATVLIKPALAPLLASVFLFSSACTTDAPNPEPSLVQRAKSEIDSIAHASVDRGFAPGVVAIVYEQGDEAHSVVYGDSNIETEKAISRDSLFRIYSMTKPVTVVAALTLAEDGKINLDDPVSQYLPAFSDATIYKSGETLESLETEPPLRALTIRDLMRHTAGMTYKSPGQDPISQLYVLRGIDTGSGADIPPGDGTPPVDSSIELSNRIAAIPLLNHPGAKFTYGNATDVLGAIVEVASGMTLGAFMEERIFAPLEMNDTSFRVRSDQTERFAALYGAEQTVREAGAGEPVGFHELPERGALKLIETGAASVYSTERAMHYGGAGLVSTADDYMKFARMLLSGGALNGVRILSEASVEEMSRNQLSGEALAASQELVKEGLTFGLGVATVVSPGAGRYSAPTGSYFWGGAASTMFWVDPQNEIAVVVMTQVFGGDFRLFVSEISDAIYGDE